MEPRPGLNKVMLAQPNFSWTGKRTWKLHPYSLGLLNAVLRQAGYDSWIFDANLDDLTEEQVREELRRTRPDVVGLTTYSTEYVQEPRIFSRLVREELPEAVIMLGGVLPTMMPETAAADPNLDFCVLGEGEERLPRLLACLREGGDLSALDGLAYGDPLRVQPLAGFITDLDAVPFPDYTGADFDRYANIANRYAHHFLPRRFPYATTMSARGCPYHCIFCAGHLITGRQMRLRSAANVLAEVDHLYQERGVREVIFLDDHFLASRPRTMEILHGLQQRQYDMSWKCANVNVMQLDREILELMRETGSYQLTISVESGVQEVLTHLVKKPIRLDKVPGIMEIAAELGFDTSANFIIGFPGETWEQIRATIRYAESLNVSLVNFHIATPLPLTELMQIALDGGYLTAEPGAEQSGYTRGLIETPEFTPLELQILRAFEWDRINFASPERKAAIARMEGLTLEELEDWRIRTRKALGTTIGWKDKP